MGTLRRASVLSVGVVMALVTAGCGETTSNSAAASPKPVIVGLITKTDANPFFVKMRQGAEREAAAKGAVLMTGAGKDTSDAAGEVTALENMVSAGAKAILITPDSAGVTAAVKKARTQGVLVIALDSPTDPVDAADALFATDNGKAGQLIGQYAKASVAGKTGIKIAMFDEAPGSTVGKLRHDGFLKGYGISDGDPQIVCVANGGGNQTESQTAMENCLTKDSGINVVYTINEPSAFGVYKALQNRGKQNGVLIVSVDGGCTGVALLHHPDRPVPDCRKLVADHPAGRGGRHPRHRPDPDHPDGRRRPVQRRRHGLRHHRDDPAGRDLSPEPLPRHRARDRRLPRLRPPQRVPRRRLAPAALHRDAGDAQHRLCPDTHHLKRGDDRQSAGSARLLRQHLPLRRHHHYLWVGAGPGLDGPDLVRANPDGRRPSCLRHRQQP